jgi:hypothetical protein
MKVGILGGSGYIGSHILRAINSAPWEVAVARRSAIDYGDVDRLFDWIRSEGVSFLINAAGFTGRPNVDACEFQKAECLLGNAVLPGIVRSACEKRKSPSDMCPAAVFSLGTNPTALDSPNLTRRIFPSERTTAAFIRAAKHWAKNCWKAAKTVMYGDFASRSTTKTAHEIICPRCCDIEGCSTRETACPISMILPTAA